MNAKLFSLLERAGWTAAQAALSLVVVEAASLPVWWAPILATAASAGKTWVVNRNKIDV